MHSSKELSPFWEKVEKVNSKLIIPAVVILLFIIIYELFLHIENHTLELLVKILDGFVILVFVVDLIFLGWKAQSTKFFFKNYWLDILAVFPFGLIFNLVEQIYRVLAGTERFVVGQAIVHEGLELRKEARLVSKSARLSKFFRIGARLLRIITKTRLFSGFQRRKYVPGRKDLRQQIVPHPAYFMILLMVIIIIFLFAVERLPEQQVPQEIEKVLTPLQDKTYITTAKFLREHPKYKAGINVKSEIGHYLTLFATKNYTAAAQNLISFQDQLNGLDLFTALEVDAALAEAIQGAAEQVRSAGRDIENERTTCQIFNGLLNPSLLVMDLTLWTGKSPLYLSLQQSREIGTQCLFYYPQLSQGMFTYDVWTGRIVQRSVFCDPSEAKSKCFGVWDYFWKFAVDPQEGAINYGVGCTMTEWMNQGFVCTKGVDIRNDQLKATYIIVPHYGTTLEMARWNIKDYFQNALGVSGKSIIDNVKQKCAKMTYSQNKSS
ncbi:MAG: hypothetical protein AABX13_00515 [Nanoarchaeota archaeon]